MEADILESLHHPHRHNLGYNSGIQGANLGSESSPFAQGLNRTR